MRLRERVPYTIDKYLDDLNRRYNGIDSVLIWQAYPNLGIDSRIQFQLLDELPAGGLSELVDAFHKRDVKVFIPYNPWDTGTHASCYSDADMIKSYVDKYGVDGFNGDTMYGVESQFIEPSFTNKSSKLIVAEPESGLPDADIQFDLQPWAYLVYPDSSYYTFEPMISRPKWFESRHMVQVCNRWSENKTADLQIAFINGVGLETWENVWGIWNGMSDRDADLIRRVSLIYRYFGGDSTKSLLSRIDFLDLATRSEVASLCSSSSSSPSSSFDKKKVGSMELREIATNKWFDFCQWLMGSEESVSHSLNLVSARISNPLEDPIFKDEFKPEMLSLRLELESLIKEMKKNPLFLFDSSLSFFELELRFKPFFSSSTFSSSSSSATTSASSFFASRDWVPLLPITQTYGIFSSLFPSPSADVMAAVWNIVNRLAVAPDVVEIQLPCEDDTLLYDLMLGEVIKPTAVNEDYNFFDNLGISPAPLNVPGASSNKVCTYELANSDRANQFVLASLLSIQSTAASDESSSLQSFLKLMNTVTSSPLSSFSSKPKFLQQTMVNFGKATVTSSKNTSSSSSSSSTDGMVLIPSADSYNFVVQGAEIESSPNQEGRWVDCQFPWESSPSKYHNTTLSISAFYMDVSPVTNVQYKAFVDSSGYKPSDAYNFLRDWIIDPSNGLRLSFPDGWDKKPVSWVSIEDAKAFCSYNSKRLPNDWEWQYAAQGGVSTRIYPWGDTYDYNNVPQYDVNRDTRPLDDVDAHVPEGLSLFGVADMWGNAFEMTNEFVDAHTRTVLLRGSTFYYPQGSGWYIRQPSCLMQHQRMLLMSSGMDRSSMVTFRCVRDLE